LNSKFHQEYTLFRTTIFAIALTASVFPASATTLVQKDFLSAGDHLLVDDTSTGLEWLTPVYTEDHVYDDAFVASIIANDGFRYATAAEADALIVNDFGNPPTAYPGTTAGYTDAANFFNMFGIAENMGCSGGPCPRTQGLTSTVGGAGTHYAFGMIQIGSTGYAIINNPWLDNTPDMQMGSFLVRPTATPTPEPATFAMLGVALVAGGSWARRRRRG
jgi:hypothetical protein